MQSLAKAKWNEIYGLLATRLQPWAFFDKMIEEEVFHSTDLYFAQTLIRKPSEANENYALFLAYLFKAAREGHLCVNINEKSVHPILEGFETELIEKIIQGSQNYQLEYIHKDGNNYYILRNWNKETECLKLIQELLATEPTFKANSVELQKNLEKIKLYLLPEQAEAILSASQNALTILTGGPGTGKTYTAGHMIRTLWESLPKEQQKDFEIVLAAPTGKAASNLQNSMQRALKGLPLADNIQSQTLHSLLKIFSKRKDEIRLTADLVLVDECSMIDTHVMSKLLKAIKPGSRLILLGDKYQLPSVEIGAIFANLADHLAGTDKCVELAKCMRSELQGLVDFAQGIKLGNLNLTRSYEGVSFPEVNNYFEHPNLLTDYLAQQIKKHEFGKFRILSPLRKGPLGVDSLNRQIYQGLCKSGLKMQIPIMITQNHEDTELFNGDVGVLITSKNPYERLFDKTDYAEINGRTIPALLLPNYELAYCMSIHKSQGSEFEKVLLILPEKSDYFGREVFYTAVTRAKRSIDIMTTPTILQAVLAKPAQRHSGLLPRLSKCVS